MRSNNQQENKALTPMQKQAVYTLNGPVLILAHWRRY